VSCHVPGDAGPESLVFVTDAAQLAIARQRRAAILVVQRELADQLVPHDDAFGCCFAVSSIPMGMAVLLAHFDRKRERFTQWGERHPYRRGAPVRDARARRAPRSLLRHRRRRLDRRRLLHRRACGGREPRASRRRHDPASARVRGGGCEIGRDCEVHPHTSIGSDGFGYAVGASRRPQKIAHLGNVCIGDEVEIGSNCAIDRAKLASTHIRSGTKLDNVCHVAHNCDLGEDGLYTAGFMMAGSTTIGRRFMTGGNSVVSAHLTLADDVVLAGRSTVTSDVREPGQYGGYPLQPLKDAMRTLASLGQLNQMRKNLNRVLKHLQLPDRP
jgi:UDP-3-O-[3-hydroxymyristoyl] glucosamine N-acyltransferase